MEFSIRHADNSLELDPRKLEDGIVTAVEQLKKSIDIPLIVKLTRGFTSISNLAGRLKPHISGIVLFGRAPVIDVELDSLKQTSRWNLTESGTIVSSLEPIIHLRNHYPDLSLAACGGIGTSTDFIKALLAGANAAMVTSAVYREGTTVLGSLLQGLTHFMDSHNIRSLAELSKTRLEMNRYLIRKPAIQKMSQYDIASKAITCDRFGHVKPAE